MGHQSSLYYYAPSKQHLEKQYCQALTVIAKQWSRYGEDVYQHCETNVNAATDRPLHIGSEIVPTSNYVGELVTHLINSITQAKQHWCGTQSLIEFHNQYTAYVIAMLMFSTGYRSIRDPVPREAHINLRRGVIVIADKINDSHSHARMLPIPPLMIEQYQRYLSHRRHLLSQLNTFIQEDWGTPFWFMDSLAKPIQVTPRRLQDRFNWPGNPPLNANRHYLRTYLCENGVPGEYVDAFMGHWDIGQTPWDRYSTFCPRRYRHAVTTVIDQLLVTQGWKTIPGYV